VYIINHSSGSFVGRCKTVGGTQSSQYISQPPARHDNLPCANMLRILFCFLVYALVVIFFTVLSFVFRRRFRQRHLWNIPGPPNASVVSGNLPHQRRSGVYTDQGKGHIYRMFNPYAFPFHEELYKNYGRVARIYGFFGVCLAS
jgi:hypothetical protein